MEQHQLASGCCTYLAASVLVPPAYLPFSDEYNYDPPHELKSTLSVFR